MSKKKSASFEDSLKELTGIVEQLEKGKISLDDSLKQYERGVELSQNCHKLLESAEQKINILNKDEQMVNLDEDSY